MDLMPGDIVLTRSEGFVGRLIRAITRTVDEKHTKATRCGIMVDERNVVEALSKVVKRDLRTAYGRGSGTQVAVFRWRGLSQDEIDTVVAKVEKYKGMKYGWSKIVAHALDRILGGIYLFRLLTCMDRYPICSWVVAYSYYVIGKDLGVLPNKANSDNIWNYCTQMPSKGRFEVVFPLGNIGSDD
jgi:hypothetical protein